MRINLNKSNNYCDYIKCNSQEIWYNATNEHAKYEFYFPKNCEQNRQLVRNQIL